MGYAEGARLSLTMGGWQVTSWVLVFFAALLLDERIDLATVAFAVAVVACVAVGRNARITRG